MINLVKLFPAIRNGLRLSGIVRSRTTKDQWAGTGLVATACCIAVAVVSRQYPGSPLDDEATQLALIGIVIAVVSPLISRVLAFWHGRKEEVIEPPPSIVVRVCTEGELGGVWHEYNNEAALKNWDYAVGIDGRVYDLREGVYTGEEVRLSPRERAKFAPTSMKENASDE